MKTILKSALLAMTFAVSAPAVFADTDPYVGEIMITANEYCPLNWAAANGQLLSVTPNMALYSLIGTTFGGDGRTFFMLPDLRGASVIGTGDGAGLTPRTRGEKSGATDRMLTVEMLPAHTHDIAASLTGNAGVEADPYATGSADVLIAGENYGQTTSEGHAYYPVDTMDPYVTVQYCISLGGNYPPRP